MATPTLAGVDLGIIVVYFLAVLAIGFWVARTTESGEDLFLAGRKLRWGPIGLSLFASNISSTTLIGLAGAAYTTGISVANYEWLAAAILAFFAAYFVPFYIGSRISTVPEFLQRRFDRRSRLYFSTMSIFTSVVVDTAGSLYAGALVLRVFFPGLNLFVTCAILALVAGIYTAAGGLAAVVYTDVIQAVVLLVGSTLLTYLLFADIDFSWAAVQAAAEPGMLSLIRPLDDPFLPWLGTLIGLPVLGFYFWGTNQFIVQRVLGARSVEDARWGCILAGFLKLPVLFIMVLPGVMARIQFPALENGDQVFPTLVAEFLPVGVVGLVMAGLIAAIMSSIDSTLNSAAALVTLDFVTPKHPEIGPEQTAKLGRWVVVGFMVFSALWAPMIDNFKGLFAYLQAMYAFLVPPVVAIFILGLFWRRSTPKAAFVTLVLGHAISLSTFVAQSAGWMPEVHFTILAGVFFFLSAAICVVVSLGDEPQPLESILDVLFRPAPRRLESPVWKDWRVWNGVMIVAMSALVVSFW